MKYRAIRHPQQVGQIVWWPGTLRNRYGEIIDVATAVALRDGTPMYKYKIAYVLDGERREGWFHQSGLRDVVELEIFHAVKLELGGNKLEQ